MLRTLGVLTLLRWFVVAAVLLALWQGFNGDLGAIAAAAWSWVQAGADVVTRIWTAINAGR